MKSKIQLGYRGAIRTYTPRDVKDHLVVDSKKLASINSFLEYYLEIKLGMEMKYPYDEQAIPYCFNDEAHNSWGDHILLHKFMTTDERNALRIIMRKNKRFKNLNDFEGQFTKLGFPIKRVKLLRDPNFSTESERNDKRVVAYGYITAHPLISKASELFAENAFPLFEPEMDLEERAKELVLV